MKSFILSLKAQKFLLRLVKKNCAIYGNNMLSKYFSKRCLTSLKDCLEDHPLTPDV